MYSSYQNRADQLITLISQLRQIGAQAEIDLPCIVVTGNQSVGKSSLLQALCGISLPRGVGTCTRCAVEITMRKTGDSEIIVGTRINGVKVETGRCTGGKDVDVLVRRAQVNLLGGSEFSRDVVWIEILGSEVDLSLVDLPGIIQSVQAEQKQDLIVMIENMTREYISRERTIILAVFTCKDEMENQKIFHMAREVDPLGERTVGVLTKPDTIEQGGHERWMEVMMGRQYSLRRGYYMVKMDNQRDAESLKSVDVLQREQLFFESSAVWKTVLRKVDRFGIMSLRSQMSDLLRHLIESSLPGMKQCLQTNLDEVNAILQEMPAKAEGNRKIEVLQAIRQFSTVVNYHINAQQNLKVFNQKIRRQFESFKDAVIATRPILFNGDISGGFFKASGGKGEKGKYEFSLEDLKGIVSSQKGRELTGYSSYGAFEFLVKKTQVEWKPFVSTLAAGIDFELTSLVSKLGEEMFGRFEVLKGMAGRMVYELQSDIKRACEVQLSHIVAMEARFPFTVNSSAFARLKGEIVDQLSESGIEKTKVDATNKSDAVRRAVNALSEVGLKGLSPIGLMNKLGGNTDGHLLELLAGTIAYFEISSARFIDQVCMSLEYHFLNQFGGILEKEMIQSLGILDKGEEELKVILREDSAIALKREANEKRKAILEKISIEMSRLSFQ